MTKVLITGGTGLLGSALIPKLQAAGYEVRISSRRPKPASATTEWAQVSLESGDGLEAAVQGVDVILHCASDAVKPAQVDGAGTEHLLQAAKQAGVAHFLYISILGVDQIPFYYYQQKYRAEQAIEQSGIPYTILRAPQFYEFIERILNMFTRLPVGLIPKGWQHQPMDVHQVADRMIELVQAGASNQCIDIAGTRTYEMIDLARSWLAAQGKRKPLIQVPLPGQVSARWRQGCNTAPHAAVDGLTWENWLQQQYG